MLTVYHSNQLDLLRSLMAHIIKQQPLKNPLAEEVILVQSPGMAQWLQISLAQEQGIVANMAFPLPATFIWEMFTRILPDIPKESAFSKSGMCWKLMAVLPDMLAQPAFSQLRHYLMDDADQRKLFQLAMRVADLFDQYLVYRPDWLNLWEKGQRVADEALAQNQEWQAQLWCRLVALTQDLSQPEWHRANLYQRFIQRLATSCQRPENLPERLFICGISALPPVYLQALQALGQHIDVHLMFTNPCRHYWGDIQNYAFLARLQRRNRLHYLSQQPLPLFRDPEQASGLFNPTGEQNLSNPLLASWGKLGRDMLYLLAGLETNEVSAFVAVGPENLLKSLQHDLLELADHTGTGTDEASLNNSKGKRILQAQDRSFSLHLCHSPLREVEVLQDYLLQLMAQDNTLAPRDIIVMVADIDSYAPYIQAVFGNAPRERFMPFAISDRRARHAHPVIPAFLSLLSLPDSRFTCEEVLALLEVPALAEHFSIDETGLRRLRLWVEESGIRWGLDDSMVQELALPVTGQHTWQFGLTRMLLGYAMESEAGEWQGILPYDESSGLIAELAGNLACLLERLSYWRTQLKAARLLSDWQPLCRALLDDFFNRDTDSEAAIALTETQWLRVINYGLQARFSGLVPISLLRDDLTDKFDQERISQRFLAGSVNFCTLMPMRSIPFRIVCLLGMNDGVYPRTLLPLGFDLMSQQTRRGDRSRRDDDRYLFLEALLSAQERLYISYIGRTIQDNSKRYPSVLLSELTDYIAQSFVLAGDEELDVDASAQRVMQQLQHLHSRTPFAVENFRAENPWCSFAAEWLPAASGSGRPHPPFMQPLEPLKTSVIPLEQFLRFWRHPVRAFFTQRLRVSFYAEDTGLADTEPFTLDNLSCYQLNTDLLNTLVEEGDSAKLQARYRAAGRLPYGAFGELVWLEQLAEIQLLADQIRAVRQSASQQEIVLKLGGQELSGWMTEIQPDGLLRWRPGILNIMDGLQLWLQHLIWCASGGQGNSRIFGRKGSNWRFTVVEPLCAQAKLEHYIQGYLSGMQRPLLLTRSGAAWLESLWSTESRALLRDEAALVRARTKCFQLWQGTYHSEGECKDIWLQRILRNPNDNMFTEMACQAEHWLLPVLEARLIAG